MKIFYGWVLVGLGIVVTCIGVGAMLSLSVFLQPMSDAMGWSRTGISTAALLNWLCMGVGSFLWGTLSDRWGTRAVLLCGGVLLGVGLMTASQAATLGQFQILYGVIVGLAAGSFFTPLTATTTRWFTRHRSLAVALVSAGLGLGATTVGPLARWIITNYDWRVAMMVIGELAWVIIIPAAFFVREPPASPSTGSTWARSASGSGPWPSRSPSARLARSWPRCRVRVPLTETRRMTMGAKSGTVFTDAPPMSAEQLVMLGLITHIDEHFGSIRKTVGK
jgi:MFS family permease